MDTQDIDRLAAELLAAPRMKDLPPMSARHPEMTLDDAYAVQRSYARLREEAGDTVVGRKVAILSAKQQVEAGTAEPLAGRMFESVRIADGGDLARVAGATAVVECELAFVLGTDLHGPGVSVDEVLAATAAIVPAFEIVERRFPDGATLPDRVAVNHSAGFVLGSTTLTPADVDRIDTELSFELDGVVVSTGPLCGAMGDPALVVVWLVNHLATLGEHLRAGDIVLTGKIVPEVPATSARTFRALCGGGLGTITVIGLG
jgi:2-oxopent-4-enoate/cis-2-oxohex-4-enoate hydratase